MLIVVALIVTTGFGLFLQLYYALAAVIAVYHDVLVTVGFCPSLTKNSICRSWRPCSPSLATL